MNLMSSLFQLSVSITAETVETFFVTSVHMGELLLLLMRMLSLLEFVTDAWYVCYYERRKYSWLPFC